MASLIRLPPELISQILGFVDPKDLAQVNLTCQFLYRAVRDNIALFRTLYLRLLDDPGAAELDWIKEIKDIVKLEALCASSDVESLREKQHLDFVYHTTTRLLARCTASKESRPRPSVTYRPSRNTLLLRRYFANSAAVDAFLCQSSLFQHRATDSTDENHLGSSPSGHSESGLPRKPLSPQEKQMSAKLHSLFGAMVLQYSRPHLTKTCPAALGRVYDMRKFTRRNRWGPFLDEGPGPSGIPGNEDGQLGLPEDRVDWEMVEAIMVAIWVNMKFRKLDRVPFIKEAWGVPFAGCWPNSYIPINHGRQIHELDQRDPYGIAGVWIRFVCFLDYHDFFAYNFPDHNQPGMPRGHPDFNEFAQAGRLIVMKLHVTEIKEPGPEDGQALPVVHFKGIARAIDDSTLNAHSEMKGFVRLTRQGDVHWTAVSSYHGETRWRSESIQIGGVRSNKVIGTWFDTNYDAAGPCGPSAFWKLSDRLPNTDDERFDRLDFLALHDHYHTPASNTDTTTDDDDDDDDDDDVATANSDGRSEADLDSD